MDFDDELQCIISGTGKNAEGSLIQTAIDILSQSKKTGGVIEEKRFSKEQEAAKLSEWVDRNQLWYADVDQKRFIARGAEQRVYLDLDVRYVIKLNDSIFYTYWIDYFHSLQLHNLFFPGTAYELVGFYSEEGILYAVVKQLYIEISQPTDTELVKQFLASNGFQLKRNHDYFNSALGLILEDLHDENVLTNNGILFFIDTVFYIVKQE